MKTKNFLKFLLIIPFLLCLTGCTSGFNFGCAPQTDGFSFNAASISSDGTYTVNLPNRIETYNFASKIRVNPGFTWGVYDKQTNGNHFKTNIAPIAEGDNLFYVIVTDGNDYSRTYTINIYRKHLYTVEFNTDGGSLIDSITIEEGELITGISDPTKESFIFNCWDYDFSTPVTQNLTVNASWAKETYDVTYNTNFPDGVNNSSILETVHFKTEYTFKPSNQFEYEGYSIVSWNTKANGTGLTINCAQTDNQFTYDYNLNLFAIWEINKYNISVDKNIAGAGTVTGAGMFNYNSNNQISITTNQGYTWLGFYNKADGTLYSTDTTININNLKADVNLIAKWKGNEYNLTLDVNGGDSLQTATQTVIYNMQYVLPVPTRGIHTFVGWYVLENGHKVYLTNSEGRSFGKWETLADTTVYAGWSLSINENVTVNNSNFNVVSNVVISNNVITWDELPGDQYYAISIFTNDLGQKYYVTDVETFDFGSYVDSDDVAVIRVGILNTNDNITLSNQIYYNTNKTNSYNNNFFYINNYVGDYYISSQEELNKLVYYAFIYKLKAIDVYFTDSYMTSLASLHGTGGYYHLQSAVQTASNSFMETCYYSTGLDNLDDNNKVKNEFTITFEYLDGETPLNKLSKVRSQNPLDTPYYNRVNYTKRSNSYNDFVSDKRAVLEYVETGEQLYHVVESGATPLFNGTSSKAYELYNDAKTVLRSIISDQMTDYEKVLSIFDYICYNSVYDDQILNYDDEATPPFTSFTSFYLEGVLDDGLAVCDGFSKTFSLLCNMEGIDAVRISGNVPTGMHAWNKVKINNVWYVVDITWSVTNTDANSFTSGGEAVNFNSKEFFSYRYFLVSDAFIAGSHVPFSSAYNAQFSAPSDYYYYANATYDGTHDFIISSQTEFQHLIKFMLDNNFLSFEAVIDSAYIIPPDNSYNATIHDTNFDAACKSVKAALGISSANILCLGSMIKYVDLNTRGYIYSFSLINLPD